MRIVSIFAVTAAVAGCQVQSSPPPVADPSVPTTATTPPAPPPTPTPTPAPLPSTSPAPSTTPAPDPSASATLPPPASDPNDYATCAADSDCIIVKKGGCCDNGYKDTIAKGKEDVYKRVTACTKKVMCPHLIVVDKRTSRCNPQSKKCELVGNVSGPSSP